MTQATIDTALDSGLETIILVAEKQPNVEYKDAKTFPQLFDFNYNRELNILASYATKVYGADLLAFCNNDLIFTQEWARRLRFDMERHDLDSISPICPRALGNELVINNMTIKGWKVGKQFAGWCFVWTAKLFDRLGGLRETCEFYCADNETVEQLKENDVEHGLSCGTIVEHLGSQTLKNRTIAEKEHLCFAQVRKFNKLYKQNIFNLGE